MVPVVRIFIWIHDLSQHVEIISADHLCFLIVGFDVAKTGVARIGFVGTYILGRSYFNLVH